MCETQPQDLRRSSSIKGSVILGDHNMDLIESDFDVELKDDLMLFSQAMSKKNLNV